MSQDTGNAADQDEAPTPWEAELQRRKVEGVTLWETERLRLVDYHDHRTPPWLRPGERIVAISVYPVGIVYLVEKDAG